MRSEKNRGSNAYMTSVFHLFLIMPLGVGYAAEQNGVLNLGAIYPWISVYQCCLDINIQPSAQFSIKMMLFSLGGGRNN